MMSLIEDRGEALYWARLWEMKLKGIELRSWSELPDSIRRTWDERAKLAGG